MKRKKSVSSIILTIIIGILILVIIALIGYILYDKGIITFEKDNTINISNTSENTSEENTTKEEKDEYKKEISLDSKIVKELLTHLHIGSDNVEISEEIYSKSRIKASELSNQTKLIIGVLENGYREYDNNFIPASSVVQAVKKVLGPDMSVIHEDVNILCGPSYDKNQKGYVRNSGCGGIGFPYYMTKNIKAEETATGLRIYQKVVYIKMLLNEEKNGFYYEIYKPYKMAMINKITEDPSKTSSIFDKADTYILTFKRDREGNYYFIGSEIAS